jgi:hypothetical protein
MSTGIGATQASIVVAPAPVTPGSDIWLENIYTDFFVNGGTALGASHKWVVVLSKRPTGNTDTTVATVNIDSGSSSVWRALTVAIGALLSSGTAYFALAQTYTKTGTPGNLFTQAYVTYRVVAT